MSHFNSNFKIIVNSNVYLKDPESTDLGQRIVSGGIDLLEELGYENFTFRKLATKIGTTEASIYRYFDSKYKMLVYLVHWYWRWQEYRILFAITNIESPIEQLKRAVQTLTEQVEQDFDFGFINEEKLHQIVIIESSKVYLNKDVDKENEAGFFHPYKEIVERISEIILIVNPNYDFPQMLVSTIIEGANHQRFFAEHLPRLTNSLDNEDAIPSFYKDMISRLIQCDTSK